MPSTKPTAHGGDDDGGNLRCLYDGDRTKPIKTMKDKFELLPAFLKVRGLGAFLVFMCDCIRAWGGLMVLQAAANSLFFLLVCLCVFVCVYCSLFFGYVARRAKEWSEK
jgi:hypothetical protein